MVNGAGWHEVEHSAVSLDLTDAVDGGPDMEQFSSGVVLVNIWASYCAPCVRELPMLQAVSESGRLAVVGISRDVRASAAEGRLRRAGVAYPNWLDPEATFNIQLDTLVPLNSVPSSVLIEDGKVVAVHVGAFKDKSDVLGALEFV